MGSFSFDPTNVNYFSFFFFYLFILLIQFFFFFFFNDTATTEIYTRSIVGSVRCVQETGINAEYMGLEEYKKHFDIVVTNDGNISSVAHLVRYICNLSALPIEDLSPACVEFISQYLHLSLIHISEPTRPLYISYAVFCLKKKKKKNKKLSNS
eukprot:TRINITY_DN42408_c0_g1_i3.p1 TRINITY_DN42408_c0_g1~~TRINITY_DN42408_c0_g1_i3.p1  ORF type:complete len:153 (-),score=49.77 TRINITY_DN42408_c0_g1_i3:90-548(-)